MHHECWIVYITFFKYKGIHKSGSHVFAHVVYYCQRVACSLLTLFIVPTVHVNGTWNPGPRGIPACHPLHHEPALGLSRFCIFTRALKTPYSCRGKHIWAGDLDHDWELNSGIWLSRSLESWLWFLRTVSNGCFLDIWRHIKLNKDVLVLSDNFQNALVEFKVTAQRLLVVHTLK